MGLEPYLLQRLASKQMWAEMEVERIPDCIECGCCAYTCPAAVPLVHGFRTAKLAVRAAAAKK